MTKWRWLLLQFTRRLWVRASLFALLGVVAALLAIPARQFVPEALAGQIGAGAVDGILNILASSMLAVTTFSLSVMVGAFAAATSQVTPRATRLLMQDRSTQNALAAFIGSFLFSLVGIIALGTDLYGERGRVVLFAATLLVIVIVVITILRWIEHLSRLGRVGETTRRVEEAAAAALSDRRRRPFLGGRPMAEVAAPPGASLLFADRIGYVQHVDIEALASLARELGLEVGLLALPGSFVHPARALGWLPAGATAKQHCRFRAAVTVGGERSFDQDPRFGLVVLSEIASRALSPAVNDPGTAIDVIGRAVRLLGGWSETPSEEGASGSSAAVEPLPVRVPPLALTDLYHDFFGPLTRDAAGLLEVMTRLLKALSTLCELGDGAHRQAAAQLAGLALRRAAGGGLLPEDLKALRALAAPRLADDAP